MSTFEYSSAVAAAPEARGAAADADQPGRPPRLKVRFPTAARLEQALALENPGSIPAWSFRRRLLSVEVPGDHGKAESREISEFFRLHFGAEVVPEAYFEPEDRDLFAILHPDDPNAPGLEEVLAVTHVPAVWSALGNQGEGAMIAVVDTGFAGARQEIGAHRRAGRWQPEGEDAWTDQIGHGTMCACIAAGARADGGEFDGVAPRAQMMSCRTSFGEVELVAIYEMLRETALKGGARIVASNSFGTKTGTAPDEDLMPDFRDALEEAVEAGVCAVFSAGNNHAMAGGDPRACGPTSIWLHKSRQDVLSVATCDLNRDMWYYSSRGPGQLFGRPGTRRKPDVTAPTPRNGRVAYGDSIKVLPEGWGTSGACPQVAGLAALLLSAHPGLSPAAVYDAIRTGVATLGFDENCEGSGMIDGRRLAAHMAGS